MRKRDVVVVSTLVLSVLVPGLAIDPVLAEEANDAVAAKLLEVMGVREMMESSIEMMEQTMPAQLEQLGIAGGESTEMASESMTRAMNLVTEEMTWENLEDEFVSIYAETFSEEELAELVEFYESPIGRKFVEKQPELMRRSMKVSQDRMTKLMPRLIELVQELAEESTFSSAGTDPNSE